jgi:hypothetical protein
MILLTVNHFSSGFGIAGGPVHGEKAAGMGTTFVGIADYPSTILYNPAGLGNLSGFQVYGGITVLSPETSFTPSAKKPNIPNGSIISPQIFTCPGTLILRNWYSAWAFFPLLESGDANGQTQASRILSQQKVLLPLWPSTQVWPGKLRQIFFLGGGVYYLYARNEAENRIDQSNLNSSDGRFKLNLDGDGSPRSE